MRFFDAQVGLWCDYVQWVEQTYPKMEHEVNVLARACPSDECMPRVCASYVQYPYEPLHFLSQHICTGYSLTGDPALKDDIRYLRLWVKQAALLPSPDKAGLMLESLFCFPFHRSSFRQVFEFLQTEGRPQCDCTRCTNSS